MQEFFFDIYFKAQCLSQIYLKTRIYQLKIVHVSSCDLLLAYWKLFIYVQLIYTMSMTLRIKIINDNKRLRQRATHLLPSKGMYSMKRTSTSLWRVSSTKDVSSSSFLPRITTQLICCNTKFVMSRLCVSLLFKRLSYLKSSKC